MRLYDNAVIVAVIPSMAQMEEMLVKLSVASYTTQAG